MLTDANGDGPAAIGMFNVGEHGDTALERGGGVFERAEQTATINTIIETMTP